MLKKRITACLVIKNGRVVQSIGFKIYFPVGSPEVSVEFLNKWGVDEIIVLDIDVTPEKRGPNFNLVTSISKKSFVPLTVGGGIKSLDDIHHLINCGADKISINKAALENPDFIKAAVGVFGSQCIVVSMDVKVNADGKYEVFSDSGKVATGLDPVKWARKVESLGAGEIFINSIDRDGSKQGYDLELLKAVSGEVSIPVIGCGGVGNLRHFLDALVNTGISAAAAGNFFHFTEHTAILIKAFLRKNKIDIRLDTQAAYEGQEFDRDSGRIMKRPEDYLEKIRFIHEPEEVI